MKNLLAKYKCKKCGFKHTMNHGPIEKLSECWESTTCINGDTKCKERKGFPKFVKSYKVIELEKQLKLILQNPKTLYSKVQELRNKIRKLNSSPQAKQIIKLKKELKVLIDNPKVTNEEIVAKEIELQNAHGFPVKTANVIRTWRE